MQSSAIALLLLTLIPLACCDCAFIVMDDLKPREPTQDQKAPQPIIQMSCPEWNGKVGCCNKNSFAQTSGSFGKIDAVFGSTAGGCDVCAVNLKRFWCEYSCNPKQADFVQVGPYEWVDSFEHPGEKVFVQKVILYVESSTACSIFKSCERTSYASQVSAMQTPAGFLNFQGTNAIQDATQTIEIRFTDDPTKGLYIPDLDPCEFQMPPDYRQFNITDNCSCNSCDAMCKGKSLYEPTPVMEGFDYVLVASVWGGVIGVTLLVTGVRVWRNKRKLHQS